MSRATVSAVGPPETQADLGSLGAGGPLLLVAETCFTAAGQAVIRSLIYHAGHQFSFSFARK
jgi:GntR family transcriptional regulator